jgi:cytochrome c-type biogenesis protein CcmH/NrfG
MAVILMILSALAGSVDEARHAVIANPEDPGAWVALGDAYQSHLRKKKARHAYQRALALDVNHVDATLRLGEMRTVRSRLERRAMRNPDNDELWGDLGDEYVGMGRIEEAISAYRYASSLDPEDGEWQMKLVELVGPEELLEAYASGERMLGDEDLGDIGDLLLEQGDVAGACQVYLEAASVDPEDYEWRDKLLQNGCEGAVPTLGADVGDLGLGGLGMLGAELPEEAAVLADTARAFALMGDASQALAFYERALAFAPEDEKLRSAVLVLGSRTLVELLEDLVAQEPEADELWGDLGDAYVAEGRKDDAIRAWRRANELDPEDDEWSYKLGLADPSQLLPDPKVEAIRELLETK